MSFQTLQDKPEVKTNKCALGKAGMGSFSLKGFILFVIPDFTKRTAATKRGRVSLYAELSRYPIHLEQL